MRSILLGIALLALPFASVAQRISKPRRAFVLIGTDTVRLNADTTEKQGSPSLPDPAVISDAAGDASGETTNCYGVTDSVDSAKLMISHIWDAGMTGAELRRQLDVGRELFCGPVRQHVRLGFGKVTFDLATPPATLARLLGPGAAWKNDTLLVEAEWHDYLPAAPGKPKSDSSRVSNDSGVRAVAREGRIVLIQLWQTGEYDPE